MAAQPYEQRELAIPMMNALNRAIQVGLISSGGFPFADADAFIAAGVAATPTSPTMNEEKIRLFTAQDYEFGVYNAAGMLSSVATAASLALARAAIQVFNSNVATNQYSSHLGN